MAVAWDTLMGWQIPPVRHIVRDSDVMLYALGVGAGDAPQDPAELRSCWERDLAMLPTMASILGHPGLWIADERLGADWRRVLHGEQGIRIHAPLPVSGTVTGTTRVVDVVDRGPGKGALLYTERRIEDEAGRLIATATHTAFLRGDGGCGGPAKPTPRPHAIPDRAPDLKLTLPVSARLNLIYRLSGDRHPVHVDPELARSLGFEGPILHGLCTYGIAGRAILRALGLEPGRLVALDARFSAPAYPGEPLTTEIWDEGGGVLGYRVRAARRGVVVIDNGRAGIAPDPTKGAPASRPDPTKGAPASRPTRQRARRHRAPTRQRARRHRARTRRRARRDGARA